MRERYPASITLSKVNLKKNEIIFLEGFGFSSADKGKETFARLKRIFPYAVNNAEDNYLVDLYINTDLIDTIVVRKCHADWIRKDFFK